MKTKIYLAGSLFNEAEIEQRKKEEVLLYQNFNNIEVYNPVSQPFNTNKENLPTPESIFKGDLAAIAKADLIVADVSNPLDSGLMMELGISFEKGIPIVAVNSDIRIPSANKYSIPTVSMNHFVLGGILCGDGVILSSFQKAIEELKRRGIK